MSKTTLFRISNGEVIISDIYESTVPGHVKLKSPMVVHLGAEPSAEGERKIAVHFFPLHPFAQDLNYELDFNESHIAFRFPEEDIDPELFAQYQQMTSGIVTMPKGGIIT